MIPRNYEDPWFLLLLFLLRFVVKNCLYANWYEGPSWRRRALKFTLCIAVLYETISESRAGPSDGPPRGFSSPPPSVPPNLSDNQRYCILLYHKVHFTSSIRSAMIERATRVALLWWFQINCPSLSLIHCPRACRVALQSCRSQPRHRPHQSFCWASEQRWVS